MYTREYFLTDCEGFRQYCASLGQTLSPRHKKIAALLDLSPGDRILDVGCGRGELTLYCAARGAKAYGIDLAPAALELSAAARRGCSAAPSAVFLRGDLAALPLQKGSIDLAILSDIVEHLPAAELGALLGQLFTVLKPGGRIVLHTSPNRIFSRWGLQFSWFWVS